MSTPPNIILIAIDDLRFDLVSSFPDKTYLQDFLVTDRVPETPTLDRIASESFWFHTCVSSAGYTPPSFATALTGTYPYRHGLVDFLYSRVRPQVPNIFQFLRAAGYRTAGLARDRLMLRHTGLARGLETIASSETELFEFVAEHRHEPLLLFAYFLDCHEPFLWTDHQRPGGNDDFFATMLHLFGEDLRAVEDDARALAMRAQEAAHGASSTDDGGQSHYAKVVSLYLKSIAKFDRGRLADFVAALQAHGLWQDSYVVVFSDHGEVRDSAAPHATNHPSVVTEPLTRVVLMVRGPGIEPGVTTELVGLVDLAPTLADLAGVRPPAEMGDLDGRSLLPLLHGDDAPNGERWYLQTAWAWLLERPVPPVRAERAVRTPEGRRYVFRGDVAHLADAHHTDRERARWLARNFLALRWEAKAERQWVKHQQKALGGGFPAALSLVLGRERDHPRFAIYDLNRDPFERHPVRVSFAPEHWEDYLEKYRWLLARSAPPEPHTEEEMRALREVWRSWDRGREVAPDDEQRELIEQLRALGYHD